MNKSETGFYYVNLEGMKPGRPFEVLACGRFTDMWGRDIRITADELTEFAENTNAALAHRKLTEGGDFAGLPIEDGHFNGDAVGWMTDIWMEGDRILASPNWNDDGLDILKNELSCIGRPNAQLIFLCADTETVHPLLDDESRDSLS